MAAQRRRLPRFSPLSSVQGKMVAVFLLLTLLATYIITLGLLYRLSLYYVQSDEQTLRRDLNNWVMQVAGNLADESARPATVASGAQYEAPAFYEVTDFFGKLPQPPSGLWVLDPTQQCGWTSAGATCADDPWSATAAGMNGVVLGQPGPRCVAPAGARYLWCAQAVVSAQSGGLVAIVVAENAEDNIYQTIPRIRTILLTWTLIALAVMGGLSLLLARTITGPIEALTRRARAMAAGDFSGRLPVQSRDEVGQLSRMFNHLAQRLQQTLDEIRAEQRRAAAILNNMTDGLLAVDAEGTVLVCNPAAGDLFGRDPASIIGGPVGDLLPEAIGTALAQVPAAPGPAQVAILPLEAHSRRLLAHVAPLTEGPALRGTVVVLHDVTARERLEAMRKEFVANVSHELRTPVTTIKLYAETLLTWGLADPDAARPKVEVIAAETDRMQRLIANLLVLSHLDAGGGAPPERTLVDMGRLAGDVIARLETTATPKGITLSLSPVRGPLPVRCDADGIVRVLSNLVLNAIDFTPAGGRVAVAVRAAEGGDVEVAVKDTGIGIPADALPRVFERFFRVDASRSREHGGSGLGLAIAREIVEANGGHITAESQPGHGSCFRFTLPPGREEHP